MEGSSMMTPCNLCTYQHTPDLVRAVNRFHLGGPTGYRAVTLDAPLRATRAEAMADACAAMSGCVA